MIGILGKSAAPSRRAPRGSDPAATAPRASGRPRTRVRSRAHRRAGWPRAATKSVPGSARPNATSGATPPSRRATSVPEVAERARIDGRIHYNVRQPRPLTAAAGKLPEAVITRQLVGDRAEATDRIEGVAPQGDRGA